MSAIAYPSSDGRIRLIDSYWAIRPLFGLSFFNTGSQFKIVQIAPQGFQGGTNLSLPEIPIPSGLLATDIVLHPDMTSGLVLLQPEAGGPSELREVDLVGGGYTTINTGLNLTHILISRNDRLYASDTGGKLYCLTLDGQIVSTTSSVPSISALAYDDDADEVVMLSVAQRLIVRLPASLSGPPIVTIVPATIPMSGDGALSVDPATGRAWFCTSAANALYSLDGALVQDHIMLPAVQSPTAVQALRQGEVIAACNGLTRHFRKNVAGAWELVTTSPFNGLPVGTHLCLSKSDTNFDPAIHTGPAYANILPEVLLPIGTPVPDCVADLVPNAVVNSADLAALLAAWGPAAPGAPADLNADGVVNSLDLAAMLAAWGACP
jgi:outer membrane protein assembly factor BamB